MACKPFALSLLIISQGRAQWIRITEELFKISAPIFPKPQIALDLKPAHIIGRHVTRARHHMAGSVSYVARLSH